MVIKVFLYCFAIIFTLGQTALHRAVLGDHKQTVLVSF